MDARVLPQAAAWLALGQDALHSRGGGSCRSRAFAVFGSQFAAAPHVRHCGAVRVSFWKQKCEHIGV